MADDADFEWQPPTEAEMKIIQARRERSGKISKIMGDYLLKGYKMLGTCCDDCSTILLEDKGGKKYCIACQELDTDTDKDDPVNETSRENESRVLPEGDSGGPFYCEVDGRPLLAGVTSWGTSTCDAQTAPSVYSRVSHFSSWIRSVIQS